MWVRPDVCGLFSGSVGSWPHLVKRGFWEVLHRVPVHEGVRNTPLLLRGSLPIFLVEVAGLATSPNVAKSRSVSSFSGSWPLLVASRESMVRRPGEHFPS